MVRHVSLSAPDRVLEARGVEKVAKPGEQAKSPEVTPVTEKIPLRRLPKNRVTNTPVGVHKPRGDAVFAPPLNCLYMKATS